MSNYKGIGGGGFPYKVKASGSAMNAVPPPASVKDTSKKSFGFKQSSLVRPQLSMQREADNHFSGNPSYALGKRKVHTDDDYFDDDDETSKTPSLAYIPAPGSPGAEPPKPESDEEDDPLDAFMAGIEQQVQKEKIQKINTATSGIPAEQPKDKGIRGDIDEEDDEESYYRYMEENPNAGLKDEEEELDIEYDADGNPIAPTKKKDIDPLPQIYHSEIEYEPFEKNFYEPHDEIASMTKQQTDELRKTLGVKVSGPDPPKPCPSFAHFGFDENLMKAIRKSEFTSPTPIQAQAIPCALGGRDIIGIAKTGSGKTAAFLWPMLTHIMDQRELKNDDGPIALILAPTRELSLQIYAEAKKFGKVYNINVVCCYGGGSKWEQSKALEQGAEIVVATPGRMIDMVKMKATNLRRVTYLVLDEADRMFNMGFEPQVRSICNHVRPDRQTLLFSATFKKKIEKLARDVLTDPVRIIHGDVGEANEDVTQHCIIFANPLHKWNWLLCRVVEFLSQGSILIFVTKKLEAEEVANKLKLKEFDCLLLHGDIEQADRNKVISAFKRKECNIMVATDVAARGLDIPHIRTVINYDIARDIDTHTHRIGRTGRAGEKGTAFTLVTEKDKEFAGHLVRNLEGANQEVPKDLMDLALKSSWFRSSRFKQGKGKKLNTVGLGYKERPNFSGSSVSKPSDSSGPSKKLDTGNYSAVPPPPTQGPGATNRYAAMKEAFKSQYMNQFRTSSDKSWQKTVPEGGVFAAPAPPPPPPSAGQASSNSQSSEKKAKRSRWN